MVVLLLLLLIGLLAIIVCNETLFNKFYPLFGKDKYDKKKRAIICKNISINEKSELIGKIMI